MMEVFDDLRAKLRNLERRPKPISSLAMDMAH